MYKAIDAINRIAETTRFGMDEVNTTSTIGGSDQTLDLRSILQKEGISYCLPILQEGAHNWKAPENNDSNTFQEDGNLVRMYKVDTEEVYEKFAESGVEDTEIALISTAGSGIVYGIDTITFHSPSQETLKPVIPSTITTWGQVKNLLR